MVILISQINRNHAPSPAQRKAPERYTQPIGTLLTSTDSARNKLYISGTNDTSNMNRNKQILSLLILSIAFANCSRKTTVTCGTGEFMKKPSIESKVLLLQTVGIADTTIAFISGCVTGKDSSEKVTSIDTLSFAAVSFINSKQDTVKTTADLQGKFKSHLERGTYSIVFQIVGYNRLIIDKVNFGSGEIKELNVLLGQGFSTTKTSGQTNNSKD
ncbi:MAG: hypothetical protein ACKVQV_08095 [Bacteroidia bacterium]